MLIIAPSGGTRDRLKRFFEGRAESVVCVGRDEAIAERRLVLDDERALLDGVDVLAGTSAAIVLESDLMWPLPLLDPTPAEWERERERFDEWLRDEREARSLWVSFVSIVSARVPRCFNPQPAFEHAATKPFAFELLREAGVPLPALVTTNDPEEAGAFADRYPGEYRAFELHPDDRGRWVSRQQLDELPLDVTPVMLQALATRAGHTYSAVCGRLVPTGDQSLARIAAAAQEVLEMPLAELVFRDGTAGPVLSDFSPSPELDLLADQEADAILHHLAEALNA